MRNNDYTQCVKNMCNRTAHIEQEGISCAFISKKN